MRAAAAPQLEPPYALICHAPEGDHGGLGTNVQMQVLGHDHIWADGDCVEVLNLVSGRYQHVALGTHANKQGRVIGFGPG